MTSGTYSFSKSARSGSAFRGRHARAQALEEVTRARIDQSLRIRTDAAAERHWRNRDARGTMLIELGRQRDEAIHRAMERKEDEEAQKQKRIEADAASRETKAKVNVLRALKAREEQRQAIVEYNIEQEKRRLEAIHRLADQEEQRWRQLERDVELAAAAGRERVAAERHERVASVVARGEERDAQLRRAQEAKDAQLARLARQTEEAAKIRSAQAAVKVARALRAKEHEKEAYAVRNAEVEERRQKALEAIARAEEQERARLEAEVAVQEREAARRLARVAELEEQKNIELAEKTARQLERAHAAKEKRDQLEEELVHAKARVLEEQRKDKLARALLAREEKARYYAERNADAEARYEQSSIEAFERAYNEELRLAAEAAQAQRPMAPETEPRRGSLRARPATASRRPSSAGPLRPDGEQTISAENLEFIVPDHLGVLNRAS